MIVKFFQTIRSSSILLLLATVLSLTSCSNQNTTTQNNIPNNNKISGNYIVINPEKAPSNLIFSQSIINTALKYYPQSNQLQNWIDNNKSYLGSNYHFFYQRNNNQDQHTIVIDLTTNNLAITQSIGNYHITTKNSKVYISDSNYLPATIEPNQNSFITINSLNVASLKKYFSNQNHNSLIPTSQIEQTLTTTTILDALKYLPISLTTDNNKIVINHTNNFNQKTTSALQLNIPLVEKNINDPENFAFFENLNNYFHNNFLILEDFNPSLITNISYQSQPEKYSLQLNYDKDTTAQKIFEQTLANLEIQKKYQNNQKKLPDETTTTIFSATSDNINLSTDNATISYTNALQEPIFIHLDQKTIIISNIKDYSSPIDFNNISHSSLTNTLNLEPENISFIKNIRFQIKDNQLSGIINL